ncbi:MAG: PKD domain-containing protein [Flavobacteriales bacterium]|nr:PKD domain-containing protein [Flavobacteriales bacterium]
MNLPVPIRPLRMAAAAALFHLAMLPMHGQNIVQIGSGTLVNGQNNYPAPYGNLAPGARHQMLILASELQAAGMTDGTITSVAFSVQNPAGIALQSFSIGLGTTTTSDLSVVNPTWEQNITTVFGPTTHSDVSGWNTHILDIPFVWDGVSNLVVQTCFSNGMNAVNAQMLQTGTSFNSTQYRATPNGNVCTFNGGNIQVAQQRPNIRFEWTPPQVPPVAAFTPNTFNTCTGTVTFTDDSNYAPTSWAWDFGDGGTDTVQNPTHTYTADGSYLVTLIATNAYGSDTVTAGPIVVSVSTPLPTPACTPQTQGNVSGFGITSLAVNGNAQTSDDAAVEGYVDRTCLRDTVEVGSIMDLAVITAGATTHNVKVWCDWDNNGIFAANEELLSATSVTSANASVLVPAFAVLNTPIRLRVIADYDFSPVPTACGDPQYGQAEDQSLVVVLNPDPPIAAFSADPVFTCSGTVQFTDASQNLPTSWSWSFGDGGTSTDQSPVHTYLASGTYDVQLIAVNANGSDTLLQTALVTVDLNGQLVAAACTPQTQSYCCGYGITALTFAGIASTSPDGSEGYVDRSCGNTASVEEGTSYAISVGTGGGLAHDVYVWMDLDNDGDLNSSELVWFALNTVNPSGTVLIPGAAATNTPVRMRVIADVIGEVAGPCDQPLLGQAEDFSVIITPNSDPPVAAFSASPTTTCDGIVTFTDGSTDLPTSWSWDFGDGQTSTDQNPVHTYANPGTYTVSLTVTNPNGSDTETVPNMITYTASNVCDTTIMSGFQDSFSTECTGTLTDDGGAAADYTPGMSGQFTIAPPGAEVVSLSFTQFAFETNFDYLLVFDGPDNNAPLLYQLTGNGVGVLPNGGVITSTGPTITIQQDASPGPTTWEGFILSWNCSYTGIAETGDGPVVNVYPQPASDVLTIALDGADRNDLRLQLTDATGRIVLERAAVAGMTTVDLDVSGLAAGPYVLVARSGEGRWTRTLVID